MGPKKDELLKRAQEAEKHRRSIGPVDNSPLKMTSGMPLGCLLWIVAIVVVLYHLVKRLLD
jgi:hypothetical protein